MDNRIKLADRLNALPPYLFAEIDRKKKALMDKGVDIISLGVGDPDMPTPENIIKAGQKALENPAYHQYPFGRGLTEFRGTVAAWYRDRFGVTLNPEGEVHALIGSKEGIGHLPLALVNPGDTVLVPDPGYPVYRSSTIFAGGEPYTMPLLEENGFLPDLKSIPGDVLKRARLMFINYPNNPTAATADKGFFSEVVSFAEKNNIVVAHDAAYTELYFGQPPDSFLAAAGAKDVGVEFHSLSKTYNMTGWRIAWICGNAEVIRGIAKVKDNYDSGAFSAVQSAGIEALTGPQDAVLDIRRTYLERRDVLINGLKEAGWKLNNPGATFYVWANCPEGYSSTGCSGKLLNEAAVVATPGVGLGKHGEGYVRFALTVDRKRMKEAVERIKKVKW